MKQLIRYILAMLSLIVFWSCTPDFDRDWDKIDDDMIRPMDFVFDKPDMSPGDVVTVQAWFAGKDINLLDISWKVSWNIVTLEYGEEKPFDIQPLLFESEPTIVKRSNGAQVVEFSFKVPEDVMETNIELSKNFKEFQDEIDFEGLNLPNSVSGILHYLDSISLMDATAKDSVKLSQGIMLNTLSQIFTTQFRLYADYPGLPSTYKQHSVRYHSAFEGIDGVHVNHNPTIENVVLYTIPGKIDNFDRDKLPAGTVVTPMVGNVIEYTFDTSKTLILGLDTPHKDSLYTLSSTLEGDIQVRLEEMNELVYREGSTDAKVMDFEHRFSGDWMNDPTGKVDIEIQFDDDMLTKHGDPKGDALIYIKLSDEKNGVSYRPNGSSMKELILRKK